MPLRSIQAQDIQDLASAERDYRRARGLCRETEPTRERA
jgi:hypothetical protein